MFARSAYTALWFLDEIFGTRRFLPFHQARKALHSHLTRPRGAATQLVKVPEVRVDYLDAASMRKLEISGPVLFKGLASKTVAIREWTPSLIAERCGRLKQHVPRSGAEYYETDVMPLSEVLQSIEAGRTSHVIYGLLGLNDPRMQSELNLASWLDENYLRRPVSRGSIFRGMTVFVSPLGHWSPIHSDIGAVFSTQVRGSRRWTIYPLSYSPELFPEIGGTILHSHLYAHAARLRDADTGLTGWECTMEEGDVLFCPLYYWHFVETVRPSISVSTNWIPLRSAFLQHPIMTSLFAIRRSIPIARRLLGLKSLETNPLKAPYEQFR